VTTNKKYLLSVVIPAFNEELVIGECVKRVQAVLRKMACDYEIIFVNDASTDATLSLLLEEKAKDPRIKILDFSRNFGHQMAITAGMDHAKGDAVVAMDADLQDPPEFIPELVAKWQEGYDVVHAKRRQREGEPFLRLWAILLHYRLIRKLATIDLPVDVGDFRLLSRRALDALNQNRERHRYIRGLVAWLGYRQISIEYDRDKRFGGTTKYPVSKLIRLSLHGILSFSVLPLRLASFLGFLSAFAAFLYILYALFAKFVLHDVPSGWTSLIIAIFFLGGVQLLCIGILGEYMGMMHEESKQRPLYLISDIY